MVEKAANDETITYKGETIRKSAVGAEAFSFMKKMAEEATANAEEIRKANERAETAELTKRANDEFPHIVGTVTERVEMLRGIMKMAPAARDSALKALTAAEATAKLAFTSKGHDGASSPEGESFQKKLNDLIAADPKLTVDKAAERLQPSDPQGFEDWRRGEASPRPRA